MTRSRTHFGVLVIVATAAIACGKKGPPLPPLRPVPSMVGNFAAERIDSAVTLTFVVPSQNLDGSSPPAADRVEVFAITQASSVAAPTREQLILPTNLAVTIQLRDDRAPAAASGAKPLPAPGDRVSHAEQLRLPQTGETLVRYYAAVASGRRRGPVSAILAVPVGSGPAAPGALVPDFSEREITLTWQASGASQRFVVGARGADGVEKRLTTEPITTTTITQPVEFGVERCFVVRTVDVIGAVTLIGDASAPGCVTPVDRFPPEPPTELNISAPDGAFELLWTASVSKDVAGYVVLRAEGPNGTLQRLTTAPVTALQYRDGTVKSGVTYVYAVIAVDGATPPNQSRESNRQVVTARQP